MFVLLYGRKGLFAPLIAKWGFPIVFAFPGAPRALAAVVHGAAAAGCCCCRVLSPAACGRWCRPPPHRQPVDRPRGPARAGMALATLFVTLPFVVRELLPILEQMDMAEEEAARSLGANDFQARRRWEGRWGVGVGQRRGGA